MDIEVVFDEKLDRVTCATLLVETIKYLLFHRFQIPLPFDQFKAEDERERRAEGERKPAPSLVKKKRQLIADLDELLLNLFQLFLTIDIQEVLLLFGATVVNPKEIYSLRFRNVAGITEANMLKATVLKGKENGMVSRSKFVDKCCRNLARTLFTDPNLNACEEMMCTSVNCFLLAPRNSNTDWFKPKATFKVPKKGKFYVINISEHKCGTSAGDVTDLEGPRENKDTLWFQAPVVAKGYKEAYKETSGSSLWKD